MTTHALAVFGLLLSPVASAEEVPSHFVSPDECKSKPCTCADAPMVEAFLNNQRGALAAWKDVRTDIQAGTGARSQADAVADFQSRFSGDPKVAAQFANCTGYDPAINNPSKIAGVTGFGKAALDPCFCDAYCSDIVDSTIAHEVMHVPTILAGVAKSADLTIGCKLGLLSGVACDTILPLVLANSEVLSYGAGIASLEASLARLKKGPDDQKPGVACTWKPLRAEVRELPDLPPGLLDRAGLLLQRVWQALSP